ncbi:hypothetical protein [Mucilaginibacter paludis]|nr:hypothetical protein [Mucilaginibacter paludis]
MANDPRLATDKKPTFFNNSLWIGVLAGVCGGEVGQMWGIGGLVGSLGLGVAAGCVGAAIEKKGMEHDLKYGKEVRTPTIWNKDLALWGLAGMAIGSVLETLVPTRGILRSIAAAWFTVNGAECGKRRMEEDYQRAKEDDQCRSILTGKKNNAIKDATTINAKQEETAIKPDKKFQKKLLNERLEKDKVEMTL